MQPAPVFETKSTLHRVVMPENHHGPEIPFSAELWRKGVHLASISIPIGVVLFGKVLVLSIVIPLAVLALSADIVRANSAVFNRLVDRVFGFMMRPRELSRTGRGLAINGATWVLTSAALTFLIFPTGVALIAFSLLILGDTAAALVGRRFGRRRIGRTPKTYEGSFAFLVTGVLVAAAVPEIPFMVGIAGSVVATVAEAMPRPLNDNIRIPLLSGAVMWALLHLFY